MKETQTVIQTDDGQLDTFIVHPDEGGPHPAIVIYMDAPGIRPELREMASRLATVGYYVMLPNLYYRIGTEGNYGFDLGRVRQDEQHKERMHACRQSLSNAMMVDDTRHLLEHCRNDPVAADGAMGCIGYCMSGSFVCAIGAAYPKDFAAIASYYGVGIMTDQPDSPHLRAGDITGETYLAFASDDPWVPDEVLQQLPGVVEASGWKARIEVYPQTGHGFAFPLRPDYQYWAGERHWERTIALMRRNLG